jgi:hypothetical protein
VVLVLLLCRILQAVMLGKTPPPLCSFSSQDELHVTLQAGPQPFPATKALTSYSDTHLVHHMQQAHKNSTTYAVSVHGALVWQNTYVIGAADDVLPVGSASVSCALSRQTVWALLPRQLQETSDYLSVTPVEVGWTAGYDEAQVSCCHMLLGSLREPLT